MNKYLNNWLDKVEGKPEGSSNKGIEKERVRQGYDKKKSMAKKMPSREREILEKAHIKSFGKPMPKHLKKDYPNIK